MSLKTKLLLNEEEFYLIETFPLFQFIFYPYGTPEQDETLYPDGGSRTLEGWFDYIVDWFETLPYWAGLSTLSFSLTEGEFPVWRIQTPVAYTEIYFLNEYVGYNVMHRSGIVPVTETGSSKMFYWSNDTTDDSGWLQFPGSIWGTDRLILQGSVSTNVSNGGYVSALIIRAADGVIPSQGFALGAKQVNNYSGRYQVTYWDLICRRLFGEFTSRVMGFLDDHAGLECSKVSLRGDGFKIQDADLFYVSLDNFVGFDEDKRSKNLLKFDLTLRTFRSEIMDPDDLEV